MNSHTSRLGKNADVYQRYARILSAAAKRLSQEGISWRKGAEGEAEVAKHLKSLGGDYRVFNSVTLPGDTGDIDHIVLGPNGVFVIETKNNGGHVLCYGDTWMRKGEKGRRFYPLGSPSKQAKRKAVGIREFIRKECGLDVFVEPMVALVGFSKLKINYPTVPVVRPSELCDVIKTHPAGSGLSSQQLSQIGTALKPYAYRNHQGSSKLFSEVERKLFKFLIRLPRRNSNYIRSILS